MDGYHKLITQLGLSETRAKQEIKWMETFAFEKNVSFDSLLTKRLTGEPLAYILGEWDFFGRTFKVNPHVLIPRPETEQLVDIVLKNENLSQFTHIFDIGTGSGVIGITLALENPHIQVIASDISRDALAMAEENAKNLHCSNIKFIESNLLDSIDLGERNLIVANLPYIPTQAHLESQVVNYEPHQALFAGPEGLNYILPLLKSCEGKSCHLWLEMDATHLEKIPGKRVQYLKSLQGHYRFAFIRIDE